MLKQRERDDESAKLNALLTQTAAELVELEEDLATSEAQCDQYEELIAGLRTELAKAKGAD